MKVTETTQTMVFLGILIYTLFFVKKYPCEEERVEKLKNGKERKNELFL